MPDPAYLPAAELAAMIRRRELASRELLDHLLARVERLDPAINAVVATDVDAAVAHAAAADEEAATGEWWGPLHGLPMTVKDTFDVPGMPTTAGAPTLADNVPARPAAAVQRLLDAGAVPFAKTNVPIWAGDFQSYNDVYGTTGNPWDPGRTPGGSSGGAAAAVAAGFTPLELGSDIGGSIRNPAHYCGVFGHKPSHGIVPLAGHVPGPPGTHRLPDLAVAGPLARTGADLELALDVLGGPAPGDPAWKLELPPPRADRLDGFRVAVWLDDGLCPVDAAAGEVLESAVGTLASVGAKIDADARPPIDPQRSNYVYMRLLQAETGAGFSEPVLAEFRQAAAGLDPNDHSAAAGRVRGTLQSHREWLSADESRHRMRAGWAAFFADADVLLCPVMPTTAFPHDHSPIAGRTVTVNDEPFPYLDQLYWAGLASLAYLPASVVPAGLAADGLPVGLQVIGPHLEDRTPLRFAALAAEVLGGFTPPPDYAPD